MLFYTPEFLIFSVTLLTLIGIFHRDQHRKLLLLVASYIFYMWWNPAFVLLIMISTGIDYFVGRRMEVTENLVRRRALLILSLTANLGLLGTFKYANFFQDNLLYIMRVFGYEPGWTSFNLVLPVGISFYTFQTLSYTLDLYRRQIPVCRSSLDFALFVAFFPQLVAGPIVRAKVFLPQLEQPIRLYVDKRTILLIVRGFAKKVLIADNISVLADAILENPHTYPSAALWLAMFCFWIQAYCDFSGYSDIAIGMARVLGFKLPLNFRRPYMSTSITDFWRRWHISLSFWLRDYLYIMGLGGNRRGYYRTYVNLMITMVVCGLWHGASWNWILWGFITGCYLIIHKILRELTGYDKHAEKKKHPLFALICTLFTDYLVIVSFIAFRVSDPGKMLLTFKKCLLFDFDFNLSGIGLGQASLFSSLFLMLAFLVLHISAHHFGDWEDRLARLPTAAYCAVLAFIGMAFCLFWPLARTPFIYFQF
jgi:D-alanyl-lipoteichoic acid acyltransferase DltB (MBOAT superfamily)